MRGGFVPLPRALLDALLTLPLTKRELLILLLVARLTHGCRGATRARLRKADLRAVGVGPGHARAALDGLLARGLLVSEGSPPGYRVCAVCPEVARPHPERTALLRALVARHLPARRSHDAAGLPISVSSPFPEKEEGRSQTGNRSGRAAWRFDRSRGRFLKQEDAAIDKDIDR